jgi:D-serine dehydratase
VTEAAGRPTVIGWEHKGFPPRAHGLGLHELAAAGLRVPADVSTPFATLRESALAANLAAMAAWCRDRDVELAPHVKTTMSPELMRRQLDAGAWGTTAATAWQARAQLELGSPRVMIANESLDEHGLRGLAHHAGDAEVLVLVDSRDGLELLGAIGAEPGARPFSALVDLGVPGGRAGVRDPRDAVALAERVVGTDGVLLAGVGGYEGPIGGDRSPEVLAQVRDYLRRLRALADAVHPLVERLGGGIATAGGSLFYDLVASELAGSPLRTVVRPGCYLVHDHGVYARNADDADPGRPHLQPAMRIWARVISVPEPGLALADAGRRDVSDDAGAPTVLGLVRDGRALPADGIAVTGFNDQHTYLSIPDDGDGAPEVGDAVVLGISHPCTTIDKWRAIAVVDDDDRVVGAVRTVF